MELVLQGWMYVIIGSHFVPLEGKFLLISLVIVSITLFKCDSASNAPKCPLNNGVSIIQNGVVKHFQNVISTCCENVVEVFASLTTSCWTMDTQRWLFMSYRFRLTSFHMCFMLLNVFLLKACSTKAVTSFCFQVNC